MTACLPLPPASYAYSYVYTRYSQVFMQGCYVLNCIDVCLLPKDSGPCEAAFPSFFFNQRTGQCERFLYGGCEGNENRFETLRECLQQCSPDSKFHHILQSMHNHKRCVTMIAIAGIICQGKIFIINFVITSSQ